MRTGARALGQAEELAALAEEGHRALASDRSLVLADEPSANLDAANTDMVADILGRLVSQTTTIVATHDPILVEAAAAPPPRSCAGTRWPARGRW